MKNSLVLSSKTAISRMIPRKKRIQNSPTSIRYSPLVIKVTSTAPSIVPNTESFPPDRSVPQITGARNAGKSQSIPSCPAMDGIAAPILVVSIIAAKAPKKPESIWQ